jgi:trans-aconitate methyltransferase
MTLLEQATIIHYHRRRISEFSNGSVRALGWFDAESQAKRFGALTTVGDIDYSSVLDIGCGYGDLKGFLDERYHGFRYIGIDQMPEFIAEARCLYGQRPNCFFCQADFMVAPLPRSDYVFASGVLSYRSKDMNCYFEMIKIMFEAAGKALSFNMLNRATFPHHEFLTGHDATTILDYCNTLSSDVRLVKDYLEDDFTVLMFRRG